MNCDSFREQFAEYLAGGLDSGERGSVSAHLESCQPCRSEFDRLQEVWSGLDAIPCPEPGPGMRPRFLRMLEVYQAGQSTGAAERTARTAQQNRRWTFWPARPAWQAAFAAVLVLIGILGGRYTSTRQPRGGAEVAQLQGQVENLRQLDSLGKPLMIRTPVMAGVNDRPEQIEAIADFLATLNHVQQYDLLPYHPLGTGKYDALGLDGPHMEFHTPTAAHLETLAARAARPNFVVKVAGTTSDKQHVSS
jgi:hypothetical protein